MIRYERVDTVEALPLATSIGQRALCRGRLYEVTSLNPKVWSLVRDSSGAIIGGQTGDFLFDNNISFVKDCRFQAVTSNSFRISGNKMIEYDPLPSRHYYELAKDLVTQREALAIYRRASSKPELVDKFLELNYHQLRIIVLALDDNAVVLHPELGGFFAEILSKGLILHCERLENDICLVDLNENFSGYRAVWSDSIEKVASINSKLKNHLQKKYDESLGKLCVGLDATVPNKSSKTFFELLEKQDYFLIKGLVSFFEAVRLVVAAKVGCDVSEVDLFYYFCGGGEVKVNLRDFDTRRSFHDIFYAERVLNGLSPILKEIGFNFITLD